MYSEMKGLGVEVDVAYLEKLNLNSNWEIE